MEKQSYLKPFMVMEIFKPQEFVALCDIPHRKKYILNIPAIENDGIDGWSENDITTYNSNSYYMYFDSNDQHQLPYKTIHKNTYPYDLDNLSTYYEYVLPSSAVIVFKNGNTYQRITSIPANTKFYSSSKKGLSNNNEYNNPSNTHS